ncbi:MAG: Uncharacterized protein K0S29_78 [Gammaproteobacteria bacterium]|jgi:tRNA-dependent cyclodipeptide synthase|nr:Uncharacterized protein [Gammaproteobacteria bacterium]
MAFKHIPSRVRFVCEEEEKAQFSSSHCLVAVSVVGQPKSDGDKFAATLKRINERFKKCTILLGDSLHRHTFKIFDENASSNESYYKQSIKAGNEWLARNCHAVDSLTIPHTIIRWDEWLNHSNYSSMKDMIDELYDKNANFRIAMFESVKEFLLRLDRNYKPVNCTNAFKCSAEYLKEECAVMQLMTAYDYNYILYPAADRPAAMQLTYDTLIKPYHPHCMKWVEIRVELKKNKPSQIIELYETA